MISAMAGFATPMPSRPDPDHGWTTAIDLMYRRSLGRPADPEALANWTEALTSGVPFAAFVSEITTSPECLQHQGTSKVEARIPLGEPIPIAIFYRYCLGRDGTPAELDLWASELEMGFPLEDALMRIDGSEEALCHRTGQVGTAQPPLQGSTRADLPSPVRDIRVLLDRLAQKPVSPGELRLWDEALRGEVGFEVSEAQASRGARRRESIDLAFRHCLGRGPSTADIEAWTSALHSGVPFEDLLLQANVSAEAKRHRAGKAGAGGLTASDADTGIGLVYEMCLGRAASVEEELLWKGALAQGVPFEAVLAEVDGSDEAEACRRRCALSTAAGPPLARPGLDAAIASLVASTLGRGPSDGELRLWREALNEGAAADDAQADAPCVPLHEGIVRLSYSRCLGREVDEASLGPWTRRLDDGAPLDLLLRELYSSEEGASYRVAIGVGATSPAGEIGSEAGALKILYRCCLGRDLSEAERSIWADAMDRGQTLANVFYAIDLSEEAVQFRHRIETRHATARQREARRAAALDLVALQVLGRKLEDSELDARVAVLAVGDQTFEDFVVEVSESAEARDRRDRIAVAPSLDDGEFLIHAGGLLFEYGLMPAESERWGNFIEGSEEKRREFVSRALTARLDRKLDVAPAAGASHDASAIEVMGANERLTHAMWRERRRRIGRDPSLRAVPRQISASLPLPPPSSLPDVSLILSLFAGGKFIEQFLNNITAQTLFDRCELIIIDADSPDDEASSIRQVQRRFSNIVYKRINYRIGIYEAWNLAVSMARAPLLTNVNVDDLRRSDSIALQYAFMTEHADIDVAYQDFYYSLEPFLPFDEVAACGFSSRLPIVTPHNLMLFNSPHNAPMWRRSLHDDVGMFDTRFRSAGDYEFWARCLVAGKRFGKMEGTHVSYFVNPEGLSSHAETRGIDEAGQVRLMHGGALISRSLLRPRSAFMAELGVAPDQPVSPGDGTRYDAVQEALRALGARRRWSDTDGVPELLADTAR